MNLQQIANGVITAVNPQTPFVIESSTGSTKNPDGSRSPGYRRVSALGQMQSMSAHDLRQLDGVNLNGTVRVIYFNGQVDAIVRAFQKGGDLIIDPCGSRWLVGQVLEQWPDWCKVAVTLQNGS